MRFESSRTLKNERANESTIKLLNKWYSLRIMIILSKRPSYRTISDG